MIPLADNNSAVTVLSHSSSEVEHRVPLLATAADVREFVQYLKLKPNGVVAAEELDRPKKRLFDERKLAAYDLLGITTKDGMTLKLSSRGWQFARNFEFDAQTFRHLLSQTLPCWTALQWIRDQNIDMITAPEVTDYWQRFHPSVFNNTDEEQIKGAVVSFFSFCQGAALGTMTLGKRGHITRFFTDRAELRNFLEGTSGHEPHETLFPPLEPPYLSSESQTRDVQLKVLIQSNDTRLVETLQTTLNLVDIKSEQIALGFPAMVSPSSLFEEHQLENCALLMVIGEESLNVDSCGVRSLNEKVLLELGAAHILFEQRVVVLADKRASSPEGFDDLKYYEFDGEHLDWELGLELVRVLNAMKGTV